MFWVPIIFVIFVEAEVKMLNRSLLFILILSVVSFTYSLPLSTKNGWIINSATGERVKLACANWPAHMEPMLAEGLDKSPLGSIVASVARLGFNCVRLTWSTFMFTRPSYGFKTLSQTLDSLGLPDAKAGISQNNPAILDMTHIEALEAVVSELGAQGIMVVLDNHISKPGWCCSDTDGNGFFGDDFFDPPEWLNGLSIAASHFKGKQQVVGMSLRNELRGSSQNTADWYNNMGEGASVVHNTNPDVLVLVSGLDFDLDLSFLQDGSLKLDSLDNKLVYEIHWYSFSQDPSIWESQPTNGVCNQVKSSFFERCDNTGLGGQVPLMLTEFGWDQRGTNLADSLFITCLLAYVAGKDMDWALWGLQGSYYLREGQIGTEETYGVLDANWKDTRNPGFIERLKLLQRPAFDPSLVNTVQAQILYNPFSGNSVNVNEKNETYGSNRSPLTRWKSSSGLHVVMMMQDKDLCLKAVAEGQPPILTSDCNNPQIAWDWLYSNLNLQLASKGDNGEQLCLQVSGDDFSKIITSRCICPDEGDSDCMDNPQIQWFVFVESNVPSL